MAITVETRGYEARRYVISSSQVLLHLALHPSVSVAPIRKKGPRYEQLAVVGQRILNDSKDGGVSLQAGYSYFVWWHNNVVLSLQSALGNSHQFAFWWWPNGGGGFVENLLVLRLGPLKTNLTDLPRAFEMGIIWYFLLIQIFSCLPKMRVVWGDVWCNPHPLNPSHISTLRKLEVVSDEFHVYVVLRTGFCFNVQISWKES
jgi:hypothetical protein